MSQWSWKESINQPSVWSGIISAIFCLNCDIALELVPVLQKKKILVSHLDTFNSNLITAGSVQVGNINLYTVIYYCLYHNTWTSWFFPNINGLKISLGHMIERRFQVRIPVHSPSSFPENDNIVLSNRSGRVIGRLLCSSGYRGDVSLQRWWRWGLGGREGALRLQNPAEVKISEAQPVI